MSYLKQCVPPTALACAVVLALGGIPAAQEKKSPDKHDTEVLRAALKDVINAGADLFNKEGDQAGCYRLYQGALLAVKPFLTPQLQTEIGQAILDAEKMPRVADRAFALRKTIDFVRAQAAPPIALDATKKMPTLKTPPLWIRLGGAVNVPKVVADMTKTAAADPKVNFSRDGKYKLDEASARYLEEQLVDFISSVTGGPGKYQGKNMKDAHKGMGITNAEYDALGRHLQKALEKNGAKAADIAEVMKAVESMRGEIVEEKSP